jgi:Protein of unknown function (DUF3152)
MSPSVTPTAPFRRRSGTVRLSCAALVLGMGLSISAASPVSAAERTVRYSIAKAGDLGFDVRSFARIVDATLSDPRGWALGGNVAFKRSPRSALRITLAAPGVVAGYPGCSAYFSCRSGSEVLINAQRWARATSTFRGSARLHAYRQMVINHEVGHALGLGHEACRGPGQLAPVMQQQSKALNGCGRNPWPLPRERALLGRILGVSVRGAPPSLVLGQQAGGVTPGARRRDVRAQLGSPTASDELARGRRERYRHLRLDVHYVKDRVEAVTTRSADEVGRNGIRVGLSGHRLRRVLRDEACADEPSGATRCMWRPKEQRGRHPTTFTVRDGRVVAIRIERVVSGVEPPPPPPPPAPAPAPAPGIVPESRGADEIWAAPVALRALHADLRSLLIGPHR